MTSCLRIVPKFSTTKSRAIWFNSVIDIDWSLAMLIEVAAIWSLSSVCRPSFFRLTGRVGRGSGEGEGASGGALCVEPGWTGRSRRLESEGEPSVSGGPTASTGAVGGCKSCDEAGSATAATAGAASGGEPLACSEMGPLGDLVFAFLIGLGIEQINR